MSDGNKPSSSDVVDGLCKKALDSIGEHVDSVIVIATLHDAEAGKSWLIHHQVGNLYTNEGAVRNWLEREKVRLKLDVEKEEKEL